MHHHYRGADVDFGVTTTFWDWLLDAYTPLEKDKRTSFRWETVTKKSD
jgi:sterol desaturase/sphingolipid hydroxylase (fatty acid hydroxylase superfamily)